MSINNVKQPITNELRSKVLMKFSSLHAKLETATTAEALEKSCFEKANNDQEAYIKLCNNLVSNRTKQLELTKNNAAIGNQNRMVMNTNFRPSMGTQMNNHNNVSDPINALHNLTVTAGQTNQMNMQQNNPQLAYRMAPQNIVMNPNTQRIMLTGNSRPLEQYSIQQMPQSSNPQIMSSQLQAHTMNVMNPINNGGTIRLINKNSIMKPDQIITQTQTMPNTYQIVDTSGSQINTQHMTNIMHSNIRAPVNRITTNNPTVMAVQHQSPQEHYTMQAQIPQNIVQNHINPQPEEIVTQPINVVNNVQNVQATAPAVTKSPMSEAESLKVKEELSKLGAKYFKYLVLALENPKETSPETTKIWTVLRDILDTSKPCSRPITLKHVAKIKLFSEKAEEHVINNNLDPMRHPVQSSEELFGKRIIPDRNKMAFNTDINTNINDFSAGPNPTNSLDFAFDDMIHKIKSHKPSDLRKVRNGLIKYIQNKPEYKHFCPKYLMASIENEETKNNDTDFDEHEFDFISSIPIEGYDLDKSRLDNRTFDQDGYLRIDRESSYGIMDTIDVNNEIELLSKEFVFVKLDTQMKSHAWVSGESEWDNSLFYAITHKNENLPTQVPPIVVRIPEDYEQSSSVDWNLNLPQYSTSQSTEVDQFLKYVLMALQEEFSTISSHLWNSVSLLDIISIYKRSIHIGYSNYENRNSNFT